MYIFNGKYFKILKNAFKLKYYRLKYGFCRQIIVSHVWLQNFSFKYDISLKKIFFHDISMIQWKNIPYFVFNAVSKDYNDKIYEGT